MLFKNSLTLSINHNQEVLSRPSKSYKGKSRKGPRGGAKFGSPKTSGGKGSKQFTFKSKTKKTFSKKKKTFSKKPA